MLSNSETLSMLVKLSRPTTISTAGYELMYGPRIASQCMGMQVSGTLYTYPNICHINIQYEPKWESCQGIISVTVWGNLDRIGSYSECFSEHFQIQNTSFIFWTQRFLVASALGKEQNKTLVLTWTEAEFSCLSSRSCAVDTAATRRKLHVSSTTAAAPGFSQYAQTYFDTAHSSINNNVFMQNEQ